MDFPKIEGVDTKSGLLMNGGAIDSYLKALNVFCLDVEEKAEDLSFCIKKKDIFFYTTIVHEFKNSAVKIGANSAAEYAVKLENACDEEDMAFILKHHKKLISDLLMLQKNISLALGSSSAETSKTNTGNIDHLNASLAGIKKALRNMAIGEAKTILTELKTMTWDSEIKKMIIKVSRHISLF